MAGARINMVPPIYITRPADFFAIQFEVINDSRLQEERREEIHETILGILKAAKDTGYKIQAGQEIIDESNYQMGLLPYPGKVDTSVVRLIIKFELEDREVKDLSKEIVGFVYEQKMYGRTYSLVTSAGLSIKEPQSYRHEILEDIAKDIEKIKGMYTGEITLAIDGLNNHVNVRQASDRNVDLYIPYSFSFINEIDD